MTDEPTGGEWGGEPTGGESDGGHTQYYSPNYGNEGETSYHAAVTVDQSEGSRTNATVFITSANEEGGKCYVALFYDAEYPDSAKAFSEALQVLEDGGLPDAEKADEVHGNTDILDGEEETTPVAEGKKKPGKFKRALNAIAAFFGLGGGKEGFYIPFEEGDFDEGGPLSDHKGGPLEKSPYGPVVLWVKDGERSAVAIGGQQVNDWMRKNIS